MSDPFEQWRGDGDWTADPWFTRDEDETFSEMGFPLATRRKAAEGLKRVFTPDSIREIREDTVNRMGPAILLFMPWWPGTIAPLLELGLDVEDSKELVSPEYLKRLWSRKGYRGAAFEIRLLANLARARYRVQRVEEDLRGPSLDFLVDLLGETYEVEAKVPHAPALAEAAEDFNRQILVADLHVEGLHLDLVGSASLSEEALDPGRLPDLLSRAGEVARAFADAISGIRAGGAKPGVYQAGIFGEVVASPGPPMGSVSPLVLPDLPPEKKAVRVARNVREALAQFTGCRKAIIVIGSGNSADLGLVERTVLEQAAREPRRFGACRMVVLLADGPGRVDPSDSVPIAYPVLMPGRRKLSKTLLAFAAAVGARRDRPALLVGPNSPRKIPPPILGTRRKGTTVRLGRVEVPPNASKVTIPFDGSPARVELRDEHESSVAEVEGDETSG